MRELERRVNRLETLRPARPRGDDTEAREAVLRKLLSVRERLLTSPFPLPRDADMSVAERAALAIDDPERLKAILAAHIASEDARKQREASERERRRAGGTA